MLDRYKREWISEVFGVCVGDTYLDSPKESDRCMAIPALLKYEVVSIHDVIPGGGLFEDKRIQLPRGFMGLEDPFNLTPFVRGYTRIVKKDLNNLRLSDYHRDFRVKEPIRDVFEFEIKGLIYYIAKPVEIVVHGVKDTTQVLYNNHDSINVPIKGDLEGKSEVRSAKITIDRFLFIDGDNWYFQGEK